MKTTTAGREMTRDEMCESRDGSTFVGVVCTACERLASPVTGACSDVECPGCTHLACDVCSTVVGRSTLALDAESGLACCAPCVEAGCEMCGADGATYEHIALGTACADCITDAEAEAHAYGVSVAEWLDDGSCVLRAEQWAA